MLTFELFLQGKQSVEVAIELDMSADEVEELHVQYWRLSKLDGLETLYHEAKYSLSSILQLFKILKDKRITKDKDIQYEQSRKLDRKLNRLRIMLQNASKDSNYHKVLEIIDQRLNDRRPLLVVAFIAIMETLRKNPYGLNLLNGSSSDIENYLVSDSDGKSLVQFAELSLDNLIKHYAKTTACTYP